MHITRRALGRLAVQGLAVAPLHHLAGQAASPRKRWSLEVSQCTRGPNHHFFGYIGHVQNTPWSGDERYLVALETSFQDRMPRPEDAAGVVLIDAAAPYGIEPVDQSRAWNFQQGTMFYWNPEAQERELFFNDRDVKTNEVFTVRYNVVTRRRIREYHFADTPIGNSGVAQQGQYFLGLNYGRLARLRPVTGYPGASDWTVGQMAPQNDGIFRVEIESGEKRLLVSFAELAEAIEPVAPHSKGKELFINHTLGNRDNDLIYFYVRADFDSRQTRVDVPCSIRADGTDLKVHSLHIGGHPEWEFASRMIGSRHGELVLYDIERQAVVGTIADPKIFPSPGGDTALSPDGRWVVNGYRQGTQNFYVVFNRDDGSWERTSGFSHVGFASGELRVDGAPCWNRSNDCIQFPAIASDGTRQMFLLKIVSA